MAKVRFISPGTTTLYQGEGVTIQPGSYIVPEDWAERKALILYPGRVYCRPLGEQDAEKVRREVERQAKIIRFERPDNCP